MYLHSDSFGSGMSWSFGALNCSLMAISWICDTPKFKILKHWHFWQAFSAQSMQVLTQFFSPFGPHLSVLGFVELGSVIAESSCYCWFCDRNSVCWLMSYTYYLELMKSAGDIVVAGHYHACWCWRHLSIFVTVTGMKTMPSFFYCYCFWFLCS
jgi:hypothetical protein